MCKMRYAQISTIYTKQQRFKIYEQILYNFIQKSIIQFSNVFSLLCNKYCICRINIVLFSYTPVLQQAAIWNSQGHPRHCSPSQWAPGSSSQHPTECCVLWNTCKEMVKTPHVLNTQQYIILTHGGYHLLENFTVTDVRTSHFTFAFILHTTVSTHFVPRIWLPSSFGMCQPPCLSIQIYH